MVIIFFLVVVTFADGDEADISLRNLHSSRLWFFQFYFENEVAFFGLIAVFFILLLFIYFGPSDFLNVLDFLLNKLDWNDDLVHLMSECQLLNLWDVVFEFNSSTCCLELRQLFSLEHAEDGTV